MSHSTKLMTVGTMIRDLVRIHDFLSSKVDITVADYLALSNIFDDIAKLRKTIDSLQLVVTLEECEQGLILRGSRLENEQASVTSRVVRHDDVTTYWFTTDHVTFDEMLNLIERSRKSVEGLT